MNKVKVSVAYIEKIQDELNRINNTPLEDIEWYDKSGNLIPVSKELVDYWKFVGLNNYDFARIELSWVG